MHREAWAHLSKKKIFFLFLLLLNDLPCSGGFNIVLFDRFLFFILFALTHCKRKAKITQKFYFFTR